MCMTDTNDEGYESRREGASSRKGSASPRVI